MLFALVLVATSVAPALARPLPAPPAGLDANQVAAVPTTAADPPKEPFFGAVQALYRPDLAARAGVQWERLVFPWSLVQKDGPNSWATAYFTDDQVNAEVARGMDVVGVATYTPQWATSTPQAARPTNVPANLYLAFDDPHNYWGQFMYKLALRYRDKIDAWVVWNEPDLYSATLRYTWDGGVEDYYQLLKVAYLAVKKANPHARVALGGLTYWFDHMDNRAPYLERLLALARQDPTAAAHNDYFDVVTVHQYSNPLNVYAAILTYRDILSSHGLRRPIWVGESNVVPYDDPLTKGKIDKTLHATLDEQAAYVIQAFALARAAHADRMSVYKMVDEAPEGPGELYGLVRNDGSTRPAYAAYAVAARYFSSPTTAVYAWEGAAEPPTDGQVEALLRNNAGRTQWSWPAAVNRVTLERGDERVSVVWNGTGKTATAHVPAAARSAAVVDKVGAMVGELVAQNGQYTVELRPSDNNSDPRDPSAYLVGGDPILIVEHVAPAPAAVDAPIQVVWPKDGAPIASAGTANVSAVLLLPDTRQTVPCRWTPTVTLLAAVDGGVPAPIRTAARRLVVDNGITYPVWDFENVDVSPAKTGGHIEFWVDVDGVRTRAGSWVYGATIPQTTTWTRRPTSSCT